MRPDERGRFGSRPAGAPEDVSAPDAPLDADLHELDAALVQGGERLRAIRRRDGRERPSGAFAASLRAELLAAARTHVPATGAGVPAAAGYAPAATGPGAPAVAGNVPTAAGNVPTAAGNVPTAPATAAAAARLTRRLAVRTPTVLPAPRWSLLAVAAVLIASLLGVNAERVFPTLTPSRATDAAAASLIRDGAITPLAPGAELRPGDAVRTSPGGRAVLQLGGSVVRMAPATELRLLDLGRDVRIDQVAGRAWHRVAPPADGGYAVLTADLRWRALGTAFDVERRSEADGEVVRLVAVQHDVRLQGPALAVQVAEGRTVSVTLARGGPEMSAGAIGDADRADPWLLANARLDRAAGHGVGWFETAIADPSPSPAGTGSPAAPTPDAFGRTTATPSIPASSSPAPTAGTPTPTTGVTPKPSPKATPTPTPKPAPTPTPKPTPTATPIGKLGLSVTSCPGGALLAWTQYAGSDFRHYSALRGPEPFDVPTAYPPTSPITEVAGSYLKDPARTVAADPSLAAGTKAWYRVLAFDGADLTIAASDALSATGKAVAAIGDFAATPVPGGASLSWTPFAGPDACFTWYKVTWIDASMGKDPSYAGAHDGALPVTPRTASGADILLDPGLYRVRIEAFVETSSKPLLVARSEVRELEVSQ